MSPLRQVMLGPYLIEATAHNPDKALRLTRNLTYDDVAAVGNGLRLPSSDEWEHACGAGSRTLWRWGDELPPHHTPVQTHTWELQGNEWREMPLHNLPQHQPNAFGLIIANDPYRWEAVREEGVLRGGDGGCACCGGYGWLPSWLPLATAYEDMYDYAWVRRVCPVG